MTRTWEQLQRAITAAHHAGDFRLVDDLETEAHFRKVAAADRRDNDRNKPVDNSRRSFSG